MTPEQIERLRQDVMGYAARRKGKIYAPIDHPEFSDIKSEHGPERFEIIRPHIPEGAETALDIGTHWGFFAHLLERQGLRVTAAENMRDYLPYLERIRELYGDSFTIYPHSIFEMEGRLGFDVVLALNIFHHFIKTEALQDKLIDFLRRLDCQIMFFQAHSTAEGQMAGAFRNYEPEQFCDFIVDNSALRRYERIGQVGARPIFKIVR